MNLARFLSFGAVLLLANAAVAADAYTTIKQRARSAANQPPPAAPARPVQPTTPVARPATNPATNAPGPAAAPALTAEQEAALKQLVTDLNAVKPGAKPSTAQTAKVHTSLTALTDSAAKPSADGITKLAGELAAAWGTQKMTAAEQARFAKELRRVLNSAASPAAEAEAAVNSAKTLLKYSGMNEDAAKGIVETLTALTTTARP